MEKQIVSKDAVRGGNWQSGKIVFGNELRKEYAVNSEAPRGPDSKRSGRGNLLRRSSSGYAGRVFAEPCEAKDAIPPCGKPQGFLAKKGEPLNP